MGVDAQMFVRTRAKFTPEELRKLSSDLSAAFWMEPFFIQRPGESSWAPDGRHALAIVKKYEQDGDTIRPEKGETFIDVNLSGRYYGKGYERGDWPAIAAVARWLKRRIPGCSVWYGGDSSGICAEEMTDEFVADMWDHFIDVGHSPYIEDGRGGPICTFCQRRMWNQTSYGTGAQGFTCEGCGYRNKTSDGGKTYETVKADS